MDIVGPLNPASSAGHKYILPVIDWATGFPEAVPLKTIDSISIAEALLTVFSGVGIPNSIMSDQGSNFTSQLLGELHKPLGVKPVFRSIYHAQGNGRQERLHSTLKSSHKNCVKKSLLNVIGIPSDRTGYSAFELLYGRQVRGPISVLKDLWSDADATDEQCNCF